MGSFFFITLVILLLIPGFLGCFINKIPGPIAVFFAALAGKFAFENYFSWGNVAIVAVLAIASIIASRMLVAAVKNAYQYSKRASWGTTIGSIFSLIILSAIATSSASNIYVGLLLLIVGLTAAPFIFAFLFELTNKNGAQEALKAATAATAVYAADTLLKLFVFVYAVYAMFFADKF